MGTTSTQYLLADVNPTGYVQVIEERNGPATSPGATFRDYTWGLQLISARDITPTSRPPHYYGFDGHGSVRFLMNSTGAITDTYDYDAFGNLISQTGTTTNNYLFSGEQFDPALGVYYNRARYYDQRQGRFWTMDTYEGDPQSPGSLHKYLYTSANPVDRTDPTGNLDFNLGSITTALSSVGSIAATAWISAQNALNLVYFNLYRVPEIIDTVSNWLLYAQGSVEIGNIALGTIEEMSANLQSSSQILPSGGGPMGDRLENIAGGNLVRNTQSYDYFDGQYQIAGQIQGTRSISSPDALLNAIARGVRKLNNAPEIVNARYRSGVPVRIVKSNLQGRFLLQGIPDKPVGWDYGAFIRQVEQLEQTEHMIIKIVPMKTLN